MILNCCTFLVFLFPAAFCGLYDNSNVTLNEVFKILPSGSRSDLLYLSKGLNYRDLRELLLTVSKPDSLSNKKEVIATLLEQYNDVVTDDTKIDMILAELSHDFYIPTQANNIATMVFKSGIKNKFYLKQYARLQRVIEITSRKDIPQWHSAVGEAYRLWKLYVNWMKEVGLEISDEVNESLLYAILDKTLLEKKFYQSILHFQPDKSNSNILNAGNAGNIREDVKKDLANYGYQFKNTPVIKKISNGLHAIQTYKTMRILRN